MPAPSTSSFQLPDANEQSPASKETTKNKKNKQRPENEPAAMPAPSLGMFQTPEVSEQSQASKETKNRKEKKKRQEQPEESDRQQAAPEQLSVDARMAPPMLPLRSLQRPHEHMPSPSQVGSSPHSNIWQCSVVTGICRPHSKRTLVGSPALTHCAATASCFSSIAATPTGGPTLTIAATVAAVAAPLARCRGIAQVVVGGG